MDTEVERRTPRTLVPLLDASDGRGPSTEVGPRRPDDIAVPVAARWPESLGVFLGVWLLFGIVGYHAVVTQGVVSSDALNTMVRAVYVWHNDPPKLAALGFVEPPLQALGMLPFAVIKPLTGSLVALPVASGFWGAVALLFLHRTFARCGMGIGMRIGATALVALNPIWMFYGGTGLPDMVHIAALAAAIYFLVTWAVEDQPRFVAGVGLALGAMGMARFGFLFWGVLLAMAVAFVLSRAKADEDEREGLLITLLAPMLAAVVVWILICWVIAGSPFGWVTTGGGSGGADPAPVSPTLGGVAGNLLALVAGAATVALIALVGMLARAGRGSVAPAFIMLLLGTILMLVVRVLLSDDESVLSIRNALPIAALGVGLVAWLARSGATGAITALVALAVAIPAGAVAMDRYPYQNLEQAFLRGLGNPGEDRTGTASRGGFTVGIASERRMAAFIKEVIDRRDRVLADNGVTGGVILLTNRPDWFADRVDDGDGPFYDLINRPWGRVRYILVAPGVRGDAIMAARPGIERGRVAGIQPVFSTGTYTLLAVATRDPSAPRTPARTTGGASGSTSGAGAGTTSTPPAGTTPDPATTTTGTTSVPLNPLSPNAPDEVGP
ncbi:MAG: hypothetical protein M0P31_10445 [Solirubrobacteraceae bacterium]|nr:hypothetical protein [Solirubrobacteraceae bacterium]